MTLCCSLSRAANTHVRKDTLAYTESICSLFAFDLIWVPLLGQATKRRLDLSKSGVLRYAENVVKAVMVSGADNSTSLRLLLPMLGSMVSLQTIIGYS